MCHKTVEVAANYVLSRK